MNILIYGFGRMGLTHFSILKGLSPDIKFSIIEPNKILRTVLKTNINASFFPNDSELNDPFDITLITTPPSIHLQLLNKSIKRGDKKIFVEKPFGGQKNNINQIMEPNVSIGYVGTHFALIGQSGYGTLVSTQNRTFTHQITLRIHSSVSKKARRYISL